MTRPDRMPPATSIAKHSRVVDDRQALETAAVGTGIEHEVVRPDVIDGRRRQRPRTTAPPWVRPFLRHLEALLRHRRCIRANPARGPGARGRSGSCGSHTADTARPGLHRRHYARIAGEECRHVAERGPRDRQQGARAAAGQAAPFGVGDLLPAHACAYHFFRAIPLSTSISSRGRPPSSSTGRSPARAAGAASRRRAPACRNASATHRLFGR